MSPSGMRRRKIEENNDRLGGTASETMKIRALRSRGRCLKLAAMAFSGLAMLCVLIYLLRRDGAIYSANTNLPSVLAAIVQPGGFSKDDTRYFGSYRPGVYFGLKSLADNEAIISGLMWFLPSHIKRHDIGFRHNCDKDDRLHTYGWLRHDGKSFGMQDLHDRSVILRTSFISSSGEQRSAEWSARIELMSADNRPDQERATLFFYLTFEFESLHHDSSASQSRLRLKQGSNGKTVIGWQKDFGHFSLSIQTSHKSTRTHAIIVNDCPSNAKLKECVLSNLIQSPSTGQIQLRPSSGGSSCQSPSNCLAVFQVDLVSPGSFDVVFTSLSDERDHRLSKLHGELYSESIREKVRSFDLEFESKFGLESLQSFGEEQITFAKAVFSNLIGSIGYFSGRSLVKSANGSAASDSVMPYFRASLMTAVPSRSFFPRGFLWDEGFHQLLVQRWDADLSLDCIGHWLDLMNNDGWIPREQILGDEARSRVPQEFIVQLDTFANPPTLILAVDQILRLHADVNGGEGTGEHERLVKRVIKLWPRLQVWYAWLKTSQSGPLSGGTFRWRGRNGTSEFELNPKTLTSGLDDAPRASHPTADNERHLDLYCWMALSSRLMADIAKIVRQHPEWAADAGILVGDNLADDEFRKTANVLYNNRHLNEMHWSSDHQAYLDFGLHTDDVSLVWRRDERNDQKKRIKVRKVGSAPTLQFVNHVGYISLFPLMLQLIDVDSPHLLPVVRSVASPSSQLFSQYGIRSLGNQSLLYDKHNTEHDPPYWRGSIWINANYMILRALKHYGQRARDAEVRDLASSGYSLLRSRLVDNVFREYKRTGYIWEQYDDKTGRGKGVHPFTGWSSLIIMIMAERY